MDEATALIEMSCVSGEGDSVVSAPATEQLALDLIGTAEGQMVLSSTWVFWGTSRGDDWFVALDLNAGSR